MIALVVNGTVTRTVGTPPEVWRRPDGTAVAGYNLRSDLWAADGWLPIVDSGPTPGANQTGTVLLTVNGGQVDRTWTNIADVPELVNGATLRTQAAAALAANRTFLALGTPTNAQVVAQVRALTQQNQALIRLALAQLDGTN